jgi:hypothetical protein
VECDQFLPESALERPKQPVMTRVGIHEDHEIVGEPRVFEP